MPQRGRPGWFVLEKRAPFSQSLIWQLQQRYFAERGVDAWRQGEVPHYVTSNPTIANAYAEMALAFWRDRQRLAPQSGPLTICELGAGSGRFAFYFLRRLESLCAEAGVPPQAFRYVLTDAADANLAFWRSHPCFEPFFADGRLDLAPFDVTVPGTLALQVSGEVCGPGSLAHPLLVVANYLFDSVPQDLFHFRDRRLQACRVSLAVDTEPGALDLAELIDQLQVHFDDEDVTAQPYDEPWLQQLISFYQRQLRDAYVLFPAVGLRCVRALAALSAHGAMLLSADKGHHRLTELEGLRPPGLVRHGSFSLSVNYHAFAQACVDAGGLALLPADHHASIDVVGLLWVDDASAHGETQSAYRRHVLEFGPDSFYRITKHARQTIPDMTVDDILAYLRLGRYDSHQFGRYLPRLLELAPAMDAGARLDVMAAVERVWEMYFPLGEDLDLANRIAALLYAIDDHTGALDYFERSMAIYGIDTGTLYNIAACHHLLGAHDVAAAVLRKVLDYEPGNDAAQRLLSECEAVSEAASMPATAEEGL
ncbi:tetratricopeptide repeat protein [Bradyrhizobium sp. 2TAF24]|uniref:tetratricopeptide repeat protein n=1 Tax=Bradyrhizobium sp. 2TAF24 TaxID=3233011 RepID=UPI003F906740